MTAILQNRLRDLVRLLDDLHRLHGELLTVVEDKVRAMKRADRAALNHLIDRESILIEAVRERDGCRRQLMDAIGRELGLTASTARKMTASQLASQVDARHGEKILSAARNLRGIAARLSRANQVAGMLSREMVAHFQQVYESIRRCAHEPIGYGHDGGLVAGLEHKLVDAVG